MTRRSAALAVLALAAAVPARAVQWHTLGPRAMGMGGAQVALGQGPLASYYNPAGLAQLYNTTGVEIPVGARVEFTGTVLEGANDLNQLFDDCNNLRPNCTVANVNAALNKFGQVGNGMLADAGTGANVKLGKADFFVNSFAYAGGTPEVDNNTTGCPGVNCLDNNQSKIVLRGGIFTEVGLGYGFELWETGLNFGATAKAIAARVGYHEQRITVEDPEDIDDFKRNSESSARPGFDVGFLWDMRETLPLLPFRPRIGVVGRNINGPTFKQPAQAVAGGDRGRFRLHPQVRAGAALSPLRFWNIAADLDLSDNITPLAGYKSRYFSLGTEVNLVNRPGFNIPLRVGLQKNVSDRDSRVAWTGGFGINLLHATFDVAAMASSKQVTIQSEGDDDEIPTNLAVSARFAFLFGGLDEGGRKK